MMYFMFNSIVIHKKIYEWEKHNYVIWIFFNRSTLGSAEWDSRKITNVKDKIEIKLHLLTTLNFIFTLKLMEIWNVFLNY